MQPHPLFMGSGPVAEADLHQNVGEPAALCRHSRKGARPSRQDASTCNRNIASIDNNALSSLGNTHQLIDGHRHIVAP